MSPERRNEAKQVLQRLRESLADTSRRNRFLNFSPDQSLEITQPNPDTIFKYLVDAQKVISICRAQERKSSKSEKSSSEGVPASQVSRNIVEVAKLSEQQLEGFLRKLHNQYQSHLEESGCNALFLSIGMLQWSEQEKSEKTNLAPLLLLPVSLEKQFGETITSSSHFDVDETRRLTFSLSYTGESISENSILLQLLRRPEYNLHLPRFLIDTHSKPSEYLQEVEEWLKKAPSNLVARWKIHPTIALTILPSSSQAMHRDLDPSAWPGESLFENLNVVSLLIGDENIRKEELPFEDIDRFHRQFDKMPTVLEADGSQTRALIRVARGSNLVIEGPPGTGKSQTIANMIALALHQGKTVLFVAEKLEALKVVRARLEEVGLGNFCLELHSKKSTPKEVIAQIRRRLNQLEVSVPTNLEIKINKVKDRIVQCAEMLNAHCSLMAINVPELNMTLSQLAGKLESTRQKLLQESSSKIGYQSSLPVFIQGKNPSLEELEEVKRRLKHLGKHIDENIHLTCLAWKGFEPFDLTDDDLGHIRNSLRKAKECVEEWEEAVAVLPQAACLDLMSRPVVHYEELVRVLEKARPPKKMISAAAISLSRSSFNVNDYNSFIKKIRVLREFRESYSCKIAANEEITDEFLENSELFLKSLVLEGWGEITIFALKQQQNNAATTLSILKNMHINLEQLTVSINAIESTNTTSHHSLDGLIEKIGLFKLGEMRQSIGTIYALALKLQTHLPQFSRYIKELSIYLEGQPPSIQIKSSYWVAFEKINRLVELGWGSSSLMQLKQLNLQLTQTHKTILAMHQEFRLLAPCLSEALTPEVLQQLSIFFDTLRYISREETELLLPTHFEADIIKLFEEALIRHDRLNDIYTRLKNCFKMDCLPSLTALAEIRECFSEELEKSGKIASIGRWLHNAITGDWSRLQREISSFTVGPVNIDKALLNDLTSLEDFLNEENDFLTDSRFVEKLGPSFQGRNTAWANLKNILGLTSRLSASLPLLENNQFVVEIIHAIKSNRIFTLEIDEKIKGVLNLLQSTLLHIPKSSYSQTSLLTLSPTLVSFQNELAELFEHLPYDEHYWNISCEILSAKIAEANEILKNLQQLGNQTTNPECQQAIQSLYNFQMLFSSPHEFSSVVHIVKGISDFITMIPDFVDPENLCNTLNLEQTEQKICNWVIHALAFCETARELKFEDDMMAGDVAEELKEIEIVRECLRHNKQIVKFKDILRTLENLDRIPKRHLLLGEIKDSLAFIGQGIIKLTDIPTILELNDLVLAPTITDAIEEILSWIKKVNTLDNQSRVLFFDTQTTIQSCLEQISTTKLCRKYMMEIESQVRLNAFLDEHYTGLWQTDLDAIERTVQWAEHVITTPLLGQNVIPWLIGEGAESRYSALLSGLEGMKIYSNAWIESLSHFEDIGKVDPNSKISFRNQSRNLASIKEDLCRALADVKSLPRWVEYQQCLDKINETGCGDLVTHAIEFNLQGDAPVLLAEATFYQQWMKEIANREPACRKFNRIEHEGVREEFASLDRQLPSLSQQLVITQISNRGKSAPKGNSKGFVSEFSEMGLLQHEITKERRYQPVRDIIDRAGNSLRSLMPCWLMSPQSVAQFIAPGAENFDLLIMDEASQIRPEEALGSIARARQVVIVGDSMQMPPSRFFESLDEDDSDEPKAAMEVVESILQRAKTCFPVERLRWHYRSKHESLIMFSNSRYYDNQLIVPPSTFHEHPELGIKLEYCHNGSYKGSKNECEALAVVECLANHVLTQTSRLPENQESVVVVAMNEKQRDVIEGFFDDKLRNNIELSKAYEMYREQGRVQIKNLESIQGDERDVVIISLTYGPEPGSGIIRQRFTSLTHRGGGRRLNVLLTRARKRMHVFSSLKSEQLHVGFNQNEEETGLADFKAFLRFAESGSLPEFGKVTDRPPDSEFECSVARYIEELGFEAHYQIGVDGFRVDVGVMDPRCPGVFLAGIECDGEPYHSHPIARERDRWREEILKKRGWIIYRIWSLDWYRNRTSERERLCRFLKEKASALFEEA